MILKGNEDLRVQKTIEGIKTAFEELICEKDYVKITVKELCDRARINKKTFYHYYPALDDLLHEMQMELSQGYIEKVKHYKLPEELDKVNREFFLYSASQGLSYEKITVSGDYDYIRNKMIGKVFDATWKQSKRFQKLSPFYQELVMGYIHSVSVGCYKQWVADGKKVPIEEIIEASNKLLCEGINGFFSKK